MDARLGQVDAIPFQVAYLDRPQAMPEGNQDHGGVPVPVAVLASRLHEPLDLGFGEVLSVPVSLFGLRRGGTVPLTGVGDTSRNAAFRMENPPDRCQLSQHF
jgi:hypothetical protein